MVRDIILVDRERTRSEGVDHRATAAVGQQTARLATTDVLRVTRRRCFDSCTGRTRQESGYCEFSRQQFGCKNRVVHDVAAAARQCHQDGIDVVREEILVDRERARVQRVGKNAGGYHVIRYVDGYRGSSRA